MYQITDNVYYIGVNDHQTDLFESMWELPQGISYNAYLVRGTEKIAVIDTVKKPFASEFLGKISEITTFDKLNYVILNHMEPDHSSSLLELLKKAPDITIVCSKKAVKMLETLYGVTKNVMAVDEGDTIDLGDRTLTFYMDPLVHWPETMVTFEVKDAIAFTGDAFGSFKALDDGITDEEVDFKLYEEETTRYFSNIVEKYTTYVKKALDKLSTINIKIIAPAHGIVWTKHLDEIIKIYRDLSELKGKKRVLILWGSMYGNTETVVNYVKQGVEEEGLEAIVMDVARVNLSYQLKETVENKGIILGFPTYDNEEFPPISFYLDMIRRKKISNKVVGFFGSSLWSGRALKKAADKLTELKWQIVEPILEFRGKADSQLLEQAKELGKTIAKMVKEQE